MLFVHSKSTEKYAGEWGHDERMYVTGPPTGETLKLRRDVEAVAIGGGSVIDTAKIVAAGKVTAVPTTFSGASRTRHAVFWENGRKCDLATEIPTTLVRSDYLATVPEDVLRYSWVDCLCHTLESLRINELQWGLKGVLEWMNSPDKLVQMNASLLAGDAIEKTGTSIIHALSYGLTALYGVSHAKALAFLLPRMLKFFPVQLHPANLPSMELSIDAPRVVEYAFTYDKMRGVTPEEIMEVLS